MQCLKCHKETDVLAEGLCEDCYKNSAASQHDGEDIELEQAADPGANFEQAPATGELRLAEQSTLKLADSVGPAPAVVPQSTNKAKLSLNIPQPEPEAEEPDKAPAEAALKLAEAPPLKMNAPPAPAMTVAKNQAHAPTAVEELYGPAEAEQVEKIIQDHPQLVTNFAGFGIRLCAGIVDVMVVFGYFYFLLGGFEGMQEERITTIIGVFYILYNVLFWAWIGATPGKLMFGLKVVDLNGHNITFLRALLRYLGYMASSAAFNIGFFWIMFDEKRQGWHDKIAGTYVTRR